MVAPIPHEDAGRSLELSRRAQQTLFALLRGLSEKQIAIQLSISRHTIHVYVKQLYETFEVHSRSELLALWIGGTQGGLPSSLRSAGVAHGFSDLSLPELLCERLRLTAELADLDQRIAGKREEIGHLQVVTAHRR